MEAVFSVYFHGASGDTILQIIDSGVLQPNSDNKIFLGRYSWESCMMHGTDRGRKACFVIKVRVGPLVEGATIFRETHGVRDTAEIQTDRPVPVRVLEMYVRRLKRDGPAVAERIAGVTAIKQYLNATHPS